MQIQQRLPSTPIIREVQSFLASEKCTSSLFDLIKGKLETSSAIFARYKATQVTFSSTNAILRDAKALSSLISRIVQTVGPILARAEVKYNPELPVLSMLKAPTTPNSTNRSAALRLLGATTYAQVATSDSIKYKLLLGLEEQELAYPEMIRTRASHMLSSFMIPSTFQSFEQKIHDNINLLLKTTDIELSNPESAKYKQIKTSLSLTDEQMTSPKHIKSKILGLILGLTDSQMKEPGALKYKIVQYLLGLTDAEMNKPEKLRPALAQMLLGIDNEEMAALKNEKKQTFHFLLGLTGNHSLESSDRTMAALDIMVIDLAHEKTKLDELAKVLESPYVQSFKELEKIFPSDLCSIANTQHKQLLSLHERHLNGEASEWEIKTSLKNIDSFIEKAEGCMTDTSANESLENLIDQIEIAAQRLRAISGNTGRFWDDARYVLDNGGSF